MHNPTQFSLSMLSYRPDPVCEEMARHAHTAACQAGYDKQEEYLLDARILKIQWLAAESIKNYFADFLVAPCSFDPATFLQVDWETWAIPKRLNGSLEKEIVRRCESVVVAAESLLGETVASYALGPEYNWLFWEEGHACETDLPEKVFDTLRDLIENNWREDVLERFTENPLEHVHHLLKPAIDRVLGAGE